MTTVELALVRVTVVVVMWSILLPLLALVAISVTAMTWESGISLSMRALYLVIVLYAGTSWSLYTMDSRPARARVGIWAVAFAVHAAILVAAVTYFRALALSQLAAWIASAFAASCLLGLGAAYRDHAVAESARSGA